MPELLSKEHKASYAAFKEFVSLSVEPFADAWDREQQIPAAVISRIAEAGYLGAIVPRQFGGQGWDTIAFGLLSEAIGRGSPALNDVLTCQTMVAMALVKWGTPEQKDRWLPSLAQGDAIAAFALTEPGAGSATGTLATTYARTSADELILNGAKKWISCAQFADTFLVFGTLEQRAVACFVSREAPGLAIEPIRDLLGFRAAGLAELRFTDVHVPATDMLGVPGFGLSHVAAVGLHYGRISTACSGAGLLRGCLEESVAYASTRAIADQVVGDLGMIRTLITRMGTDAEAAFLLCQSACQADTDHRLEAFEKALVAKYFASRAAVRAASDAVQIRGASGCHGSSPVSRFYRDAKILEIVEGTTQIHEHLLGQIFIDRAPRHRACPPD